MLIAFCFIFLCGKLYAQPTGSEDRMYWVQTLTRIADPVLVNLSQGTLKKNMPFESLSDEPLLLLGWNWDLMILRKES